MTKFSSHLLTTAALTLTASMLTACGGSSGGNPVSVVPPPPPPPPAASTEPTWTAGSFAASSSFKNQCAAPRTAPDIDGDPYPDVPGSTTREKFWLRSWTDETYLWYNEVADINPANGDTRLEYFDKLKTDADTASGTKKDQFHFNIPTEEYEQRVLTGETPGYGADFILQQAFPPRDIRVVLTQPGSPAAEDNKLLRGTQIMEIDGEDAINGNNVDVLNAGLFPSTAGETHTFLVRDVGSNSTRTVTLTSGIIAEEPVNLSKIIETPTGKVGYIHFTTFGTSTAEQQIANAFTDMKNADISDLVLDLRYNGGGFLDIAGQVGYMIAGETRTNGRDFEKMTFNDKHPVTNPVTGRPLRATPFHKESLGFNAAYREGQALDSVNLSRVFILSTNNTCSASEAVINGLRGVDVDVILIGRRTCGKPYGFYGTDNCGETYFTIQFRGENDKGFGDYADGFAAADATSPVGEKILGCEAPDNVNGKLGETSDTLLSTALYYRDNGTCPIETTKSSQKAQVRFDSNPALSLLSEERIRNRMELKNSRLLYSPRDKK